jgi:hypothetical protein
MKPGKTEKRTKRQRSDRRRPLTQATELWRAESVGQGRARGWSTFLAEPGSESMRCRVCDAWCNVTRGVLAHTSWPAYVGNRKSVQDFFSCPWIARDWHIDIARMLERLEDDDFDPVRAYEPALTRALRSIARRLAVRAERDARKALRE